MKSLPLHFILVLLCFILVCCQDVGMSSIPLQKPNQFLIDDMILDQESIADLVNEGEVSENAAGGYSVYNSQPWKNGIMPVAFDTTITKAQKEWFINIAQKWSPVTGVRIINRTNETDYLQVTNNEAGCFATVGANTNSARHLNLGTGCWTEGVTLHEIGHALGLMHEHQRPDRDSFVRIDFNNVEQDLHYAFTVFSTANNASAYDFQSIMHYAQYAFSKNGKVTINALPQYAIFQNTMGIKKISASDQRAVAEMYAKEISSRR